MVDNHLLISRVQSNSTFNANRTTVSMAAHSKEKEIDVKESAGINVFLCLLFSAMFCVALYSLGVDDSKAPPDFRYFKYVSLACLLPAIYFAQKIYTQKSTLTINSHGIWYKGTLITHWQQILQAEWQASEQTMGLHPKDFLFIQYYPSGKEDVHEIWLPISHTLSYNEHEIMETISAYMNK